MENIDQKRNESRRQLLYGDYNALRRQRVDRIDNGLIPSWKLLIFISSTFTDTHLERNELENLLKK